MSGVSIGIIVPRVQQACTQTPIATFIELIRLATRVQTQQTPTHTPLTDINMMMN